ncbi:hypothetical protein EMMF5_005861 [Cystobasidiomycetes sp. EMM_F5]
MQRYNPYGGYDQDNGRPGRRGGAQAGGAGRGAGFGRANQGYPPSDARGNGGTEFGQQTQGYGQQGGAYGLPGDRSGFPEGRDTFAGGYAGNIGPDRNSHPPYRSNAPPYAPPAERGRQGPPTGYAQSPPPPSSASSSNFANSYAPSATQYSQQQSERASSASSAQAPGYVPNHAYARPDPYPQQPASRAGYTDQPGYVPNREGPPKQNYEAETAKIEKRIAKERPCRTLFVRNVKYDTDGTDLRERFTAAGEMKSFFDLISTRGLIFVTYYDLRTAIEARDKMQGFVVAGRPIDVHYSLPRDEDNPNRKCDRDKAQGTLRLLLKDGLGPIQEFELDRMFRGFGAIKGIYHTGGDPSKERLLEFFDSRAMSDAYDRMNGVAYPGGGRLEAFFDWDIKDIPISNPPPAPYKRQEEQQYVQSRAPAAGGVGQRDSSPPPHLGNRAPANRQPHNFSLATSAAPPDNRNFRAPEPPRSFDQQQSTPAVRQWGPSASSQTGSVPTASTPATYNRNAPQQQYSQYSQPPPSAPAAATPFQNGQQAPQNNVAPRQQQYAAPQPAAPDLGNLLASLGSLPGLQNNAAQAPPALPPQQQSHNNYVHQHARSSSGYASSPPAPAGGGYRPMSPVRPPSNAYAGNAPGAAAPSLQNSVGGAPPPPNDLLSLLGQQQSIQPQSSYGGGYGTQQPARPPQPPQTYGQARPPGPPDASGQVNDLLAMLQSQQR